METMRVCILIYVLSFTCDSKHISRSESQKLDTTFERRSRHVPSRIDSIGQSKHLISEYKDINRNTIKLKKDTVHVLDKDTETVKSVNNQRKRAIDVHKHYKSGKKQSKHNHTTNDVLHQNNDVTNEKLDKLLNMMSQNWDVAKWENSMLTEIAQTISYLYGELRMQEKRIKKLNRNVKNSLKILLDGKDINTILKHKGKTSNL